jgi:hypothetical protein
MIKRICKHCKQEYETFQSIKPDYCSHKCASAAKRKGKVGTCAQCGKEIWIRPSKPNRKFCSKSCATTARNLTDQNPAYSRDITGENNPMFGNGLSGQDNPMFGKTKELAPRWTGGRKVRKDGYVFVVAPDDHPNPSYTKDSGTKYILEHRLVMESHIGRYLSPDEVVHHIDENPNNNSIENLELFRSQSEHVSTRHSG